MNPKVSILIPIYGVEKFIERCAVSLFEQTFDSIEYIFVNDCTPDDSIMILKEVVSRYPERQGAIKVIEHKINKGLAGARNTGIDNAKGEYILHIDSDDYIELNMVELMYNQAFKFNADVVICDMVLEWESVKRIAINKAVSKEFFLESLLNASTMPGVVNKMFKSEVYHSFDIKAIEGIDMGEDYVTTPRLIDNCENIAFVNLGLYHYIQYNSSSYTKQISLQSIQSIEKAFIVLTNYFYNHTNKNQYLEALELGKLRKKVDLLLTCNSGDLKYVSDMFSAVSFSKYGENLTRFQLVLLKLSLMKNKILLKMSVGSYMLLFSLVQILKGRKL